MKQRKLRSRQGQLQLQRCPLAWKELGDQIARLMAALTRAEQSSHSASAPSSPGTGVMGGDGQTGTLLSTLTPTMVGLAWAKPPLAAPPWSTKLVLNPHHKGNQNTQTSVQGSTQGAQQCFRCQGWGHMA